MKKVDVDVVAVTEALRFGIAQSRAVGLRGAEEIAPHLLRWLLIQGYEVVRREAAPASDVLAQGYDAHDNQR